MCSYDDVFLSYNKILKRLYLLGKKTKNGKEISHKDLRKAVSVMLKKHPTCRWRSEKIRSKRYYIVIEGFYWLMSVYFQNEKKQIDADIEFFLLRISQYEELLKIDPENLFTEEICVTDLPKFFNREKRTIEKTIIKMQKATGKNYKYSINENKYISAEGIEWLCKNCFKQKYLEILEKYKMKLTELYIQAGYPYDNFFRKN